MPDEQAITTVFLQYPSGNVCDANGKSGNLSGALRPLSPAMRLAGPAFTVQCPPGDNLAIHRAVYQAPPGAVLVIDAAAHDAGHFGEILATACLGRGLAGVVIDGGCRDSREIIALGLPLFARSLNPGGTIKKDPGRLNVPVTCGGVLIHPGDYIVGDADGLVAVAAERAGEVAEKTAAIARREVEVREQMRQGKTTIEIFALDKLLQEEP